MSILLPWCMEFNLPTLGAFYSELLLPFAGENIYLAVSPENRAAELIRQIRLFAQQLHEKSGLPLSLSKAGISPDLFEKVADTALNDGALLMNPRFADKQDILSILQEAY